MLNRLCTSLCLASLLTLASTSTYAAEWVSLFNGKDLDGWTPKIRYEALGEDFRNTFRVEDGMITVSYDKYDDFKENFGHLFYKTEFSKYRLRVEYRFTGDQMHDGPGWAYRNSGLMLHGQAPETMTKDQDFPASIEVQLLGGNGTDKRTTANMCSPSTHIERRGKLFKPHCANSKSDTFHGDQWVTIEVEVRGDKSFKHFINGELVMEYQGPQLDPNDPVGKKLIEAQGGEVKLSGGTISLQSESHPCQFRKVEIMELD
ncbi:MAG: DUF1080 domain-containing protein [Candidatus Hydrogenedentota bacterium]